MKKETVILETESDVLQEEQEEQEVQEKETDKLVAIRKGTVTRHRMKSETEKYIKDGWVIV